MCHSVCACVSVSQDFERRRGGRESREREGARAQTPGSERTEADFKRALFSWLTAAATAASARAAHVKGSSYASSVFGDCRNVTRACLALGERAARRYTSPTFGPANIQRSRTASMWDAGGSVTVQPPLGTLPISFLCYWFFLFSIVLSFILFDQFFSSQPLRNNIEEERSYVARPRVDSLVAFWMRA